MQFPIQLYSFGGTLRKSSASQAVFSDCSDGEVPVEGSRVSWKSAEIVAPLGFLTWDRENSDTGS